MSNKRPPDFTKDEIILITAALKERYGHSIKVEQADYEEKERQQDSNK